MNKKEETVQTYNRHAQEMAQKFNKIGERIGDVKRALSYVNKKNPKVLEIGCGNGRDAKEILALTSDYTGVDISEGMIKLAREYLPTANFIVADAEAFEFPKNIDVIFAFASLLHLDKEAVEKVLLRANDALNNGAIFYISVKYDFYHEKVQESEFGNRVFYYYDEAAMKELAEKTGYEVIYEDKQVLRGTNWLTVALKKFSK